jgi:hypothetical protein
LNFILRFLVPAWLGRRPVLRSACRKRG